MTEETLNKNYAIFKKAIETYVSDIDFDTVIKLLGGENIVKNATYASNTDSGLAYDGSLLATITEMITIAKSINKLLPDEKKADDHSIIKVGLLSHLSKCLMFTPNDNSWEKTNRGLMYKFNSLEGALRFGERSILIAMNNGVNFTPEEFEAMRIMDKTSNDDNYTKFFSSSLSLVIRQANEIINQIHKQ